MGIMERNWKLLYYHRVYIYICIYIYIAVIVRVPLNLGIW